MNADARAIYQHALDTLTQALLTDDGGLWQRHVQVPHFMSTNDGKLIHETPEDVATGFDDFVRALKGLGVATMHRECDTARMVTGDMIVGFHTTKMFAEDGTPFPPYPVRWVMQLNDGNWQVAKSDSALSHAEWNNGPHVQMSQFDTDLSTASISRRFLLQTALDRIDSIFMSNDFNGWRNSVCLPLVFETRQGQRIYETEKALEDDFRLYQEEFAIHRVTELARVAKTAEVIDNDMMLGTYRVHVLSGSRYVVPPWDGAMTLKRIEGRWNVTKIMGALGHSNWNHNVGTTG